MLHAGEKKSRKGDTEGKEAGNERTETLYQPHVKRGGWRNLKRVLTSLEASGTLGDQKNNTSKTSRMPEDR